jgi:hypothetical protein
MTRMRRYSRNNVSNIGSVNLFRFDFDDGGCYLVFIASKDSRSVMGSRVKLSWIVSGIQNRWGLKLFKDQRIKPDQRREAIRRIWIAEIEK